MIQVPLALALLLLRPTDGQRGSSDSIMEMVNPRVVKQLSASRPDAPAPWYPRYKVRSDDDAVVDFLNGSHRSKPEDLRGVPPFKDDRSLKSTRSTITLTLRRDREKDWCVAEPLEMELKVDGCETRTIKNKYCHGLCSTYFVPKEPRDVDFKHDEDDGISKFCSMCKPIKTSWKTITLHCPQLGTKRLKKRVLKVRKCRCMSQDCN